MVWLVAWWAGCLGTEPVGPPDLTVEQIAQYLGKDCPDPAGWAADIRAALEAIDRPIDEAHVCQVVAIIEQESTYEADPAVPGLGKIARAEIEDKLSVLGPLSEHGADWLLKPVPEGAEQSFAEQLESVRTEQQLDHFFRDLTTHYTKPAEGVPFATELLAARFEKLNPVTTAGSMQVSVAWARKQAKRAGIKRREVRDLLYTRAGGLRWGTARLLHHQAAYDDPIYRFADFNAGFFASRNAAFQHQISEVTGVPLATDGDLLVYTKSGRAEDGQTMAALLAWREAHAPELPERQLRRDVAREKQRRFEETDTWRLIRSAYEAKTKRAPEYARIPDVALESPKITRELTTGWFAKNVKRRYSACLERDEDG